MTVLPGSGGFAMTSDGATIYAAETNGDSVFAFSTSANQLVDEIHVCQGPTVLESNLTRVNRRRNNATHQT